MFSPFLLIYLAFGWICIVILEPYARKHCLRAKPCGWKW